MSDLIQQPDGTFARQALIIVTTETLTAEDAAARQALVDAQAALEAATVARDVAAAAVDLSAARLAQVAAVPATATVAPADAAPTTDIAPSFVDAESTAPRL